MYSESNEKGKYNTAANPALINSIDLTTKLGTLPSPASQYPPSSPHSVHSTSIPQHQQTRCHTIPRTTNTTTTNNNNPKKHSQSTTSPQHPPTPPKTQNHYPRPSPSPSSTVSSKSGTRG